MDFSLLDYHLSLFYTEMSVFSCESCQCAWKCGFWDVRRAEDLNVFTAYFVQYLHVGCYCHYLGLLTMYLDFS